MKSAYTKEPYEIIQTKNEEVHVFSVDGENIDTKVVDEFGEEWLKFSDFTDKQIRESAEEYFDIINAQMITKNSYVLDIGCGTGRWSKYLSSKAGFIEAVDPSNAIFAASKLLGKIKNVRLSKASIETLPFPDDTFDFAMSIGVLHHIPDTQQAMIDCVKKVKRGGYFYIYLYYNLDKKGHFFKALFKVVDLIRSIVSRFPGKLKKLTCDIFAVVFYMPLILLVRFLIFIGYTKLASRMPLGTYYNKSFFIVRNDALDRFGTRLEHRFSKKEIEIMMLNCGLTNIIFSDGAPFYHAVGKKDKILNRS